jgi:hypothetical protein
VKSRLLWLSLALLAWSGAAYADKLQSMDESALLKTPPGSPTKWFATLMNTTADSLFLTGISCVVPPDYNGTFSSDEFFASLPDTIPPGGLWWGAIGTLTSHGGPTSSTSHQVLVALTGGVHPFDSQVLSILRTYVDDSTATTGASIGGGADAPIGISPNPVLHDARIHYSVERSGHVTVMIVDAAGRIRRRFVDEVAQPGSRSLHWDGRDDAGARLAPGVYFVRMATAEGRQHARVVIIR